MKSFYGYKIKQWQTFNDKGNRLVLTSLKAAPVKIVKLKSKEKDGYFAYQVQISPLKKRRKDCLKEIRLDKDPEAKVGEEIKISSIFKVGDKVNVSGTTKGKGFQGVVKRWNFAGGPRTHGQSDRERAPGSIGQRTTPGRVWKGKRMPGHMGNTTKTILGLKVYKIDEQTSEIWLTGLIPGARNGLIEISKA